jgi:PAS domain S-box-containing protein
MNPPVPIESLEHLPIATWTASADGSVEWMSAQAAGYFGVDRRPPADTWARVVHPGDWDRADSAWRASLASGAEYEVRLRLLSARTQRYHWHLCRAHRLVDASGAVRWVGVNIDIDEPFRGLEVQAASMERLQAERERLRTIFSSCPVAITLYAGREHRISMMNEANRRILGGRDLEGRAVLEAFPEIASQGLIDILDGVFDSGEPFEASEFAIEFDRYGDGAMHLGYFSFSLQAVSDVDGVTYGVLSSAVDVTEQVLARRALARLAAEREAVLSQLGDGLILTDVDGRITFVNEHASELHGVARLDVSPERYAQEYSLLREDGSPYPSCELPLARAVRTGAVLAGERWKIRRPDGSVVLVEGDARPVLDSQGQRLGAMLAMREIR